MSFSQISFTQEQLDLDTRAQERTLLQFRRSFVFQTILAALIKEVQALSTEVYRVLRYRTAAEAPGENLDAIGRIVGQLRELIDFSTISWFTPDVAGKSVDQALVWVTNAPTGETLISDDSFFRSLIEGKVYRNVIKYGSVPEIQQVVRAAFNIDISVVPIAPMTVALVVSDAASDDVIEFLKRRVDTKNVEAPYFLPVPAGFFISTVYRLSDYPT